MRAVALVVGIISLVASAPDGTGIVRTVFVQWHLGGRRFLYPAPPWRGR